MTVKMVNLNISKCKALCERFQGFGVESKCVKIRTRKTPNLGTLHSVINRKQWHEMGSEKKWDQQMWNIMQMHHERVEKHM